MEYYSAMKKNVAIGNMCVPPTFRVPAFLGDTWVSVSVMYSSIANHPQMESFEKMQINYW